MGVYNDITITAGDKETRYDSLIAYLNNLPGISAERYTDEDWTISGQGNPSGIRFSFEGTNISCFFAYVTYISEWSYQAVWVKNDGVDIYKNLFNTYLPSSANTVVHSYIDEQCSIIAIKDVNGHGGLEVMLLNIDNKTIVGYKGFNNDGVTFVDISTLTFEDVNDVARIPYTYTNMFPYSAPAGTLDFLAQGYFVNGNSVKKFTSTFVKECSTMNLLSSASLPTPLGNHLAIGAHCIVPLDDEGGE